METAANGHQKREREDAKKSQKKMDRILHQPVQGERY